MAAKARVFTSFDFDNDLGVKTMLVGKSKKLDSPSEMFDWSLKEAFSGDWKAKIRTRIQSVDQVIVLCGRNTHSAAGVSEELRIARDERKPYFLLSAYQQGCVKPKAAFAKDKMYRWTWDNLKRLVGGDR